MEFDANKPIYMQICDSVCDRILSGELEQGGRIPSVRDFGAGLRCGNRSKSQYSDAQL